jgi:hypothetical protein
MIDELWKYDFDHFDCQGEGCYYGIYFTSILIVHKRHAVPKMQWKFFCRSTWRGFDETCRSRWIIGETTNSKVSSTLWTLKCAIHIRTLTYITSVRKMYLLYVIFENEITKVTICQDNAPACKREKCRRILTYQTFKPHKIRRTLRPALLLLIMRQSLWPIEFISAFLLYLNGRKSINWCEEVNQFMMDPIACRVCIVKRLYWVVLHWIMALYSFSFQSSAEYIDVQYYQSKQFCSVRNVVLT